LIDSAVEKNATQGAHHEEIVGSMRSDKLEITAKKRVNLMIKKMGI